MNMTNPATPDIVKIFKTAVPTDGMIVTMDTIEYEGKFWLVPQWLDDKIQILSRPARLIRLDSLPHVKGGPPPHDFVLTDYIPKSVLDGTASQQIKDKYEILDQPQLVIRTGGGIH